MRTNSLPGWRRAAGLFLLAAMLFLFPCAPAGAQAETGSVIVGDRVVLTLREDVGSISPVERAAIVNRRLERILTDPDLRPETLEVRDLPDGGKLLALENFRVVEVTPADARSRGMSVEELSERWARVLRDSLTRVKPLYRPDEEGHAGISFFPLLLVSLLAFAVPVLASRVRRFPVPIVVGEILVGILIGRSGFDLVRYDSWLQFLAEFGFAFLMFLSGLEVDFDLLTGASPRAAEKERRGWWQNPAALASLVVFLTLLLSTGVALGLAGAGMITLPWMMALILTTVSLGLVVPILKERGLTTTPYGQTLLLTALVADVVTMFLITIVAGWLGSGLSLRLFLGLLLIVVFALAIRIGRALSGFPKVQRVFEELSHATAQIQVRGSLALMLAFVAVSEQLGTEMILGAFLAGLLLALFAGRGSADLHHKLEAFGFGFFIPIFFIMVGVRFDLRALLASPQGMLLAPLMVLSAFAVKIVAALPFRLAFTWREALAGGFLIAPGLSLIIAAAEIGKRLGLFSEAIYAALICVTLVTAIAGPMGFQVLMPRTKRQKRRALIVGAGRHGSLLAQRLKNQSWDVTLMTREDSASKEARAAGCRIVQGDSADPDDLRAAGLDEAETVIAATSSDAANAAVCREAKRAGVPQCVALVQEGDSTERLREEGILPVTPLFSTVTVLEGMVTHPAVFGLLTEETTDKDIVEAVLSSPDYAGRPLREVRWPGDVLVLSVLRDGEVLVPNGSTVLRRDDRLTLIGSEPDVAEAVRQIAP